MGKSQAEEEAAVKCGYWHLWRFNPALEAEGKNPFSLDSKEPNWDAFQDYLKGEVRFASVMKQYPAEAPTSSRLRGYGQEALSELRAHDQDGLERISQSYQSIHDKGSVGTIPALPFLIYFRA